MSRKFITGARSVGIAFDQEMLDLIDAIRDAAGPEDDGKVISRGEFVRRLVYIGLDLIQRDHPVLAQYLDPDKVRSQARRASANGPA